MSESSRHKHAIVIGGSISGCMAAKILSTYFDHVTVIEKGEFKVEMSRRQNVPQENHVHLLLLRGKQIINNIFPGIIDEFEMAGAISADLGHDVKWFHYGYWKNRYKSGYEAQYCSRMLIDYLMRRRIRKNLKISVMSNTKVTGLKIAYNNNQPCINGVYLNDKTDLLANFVVDTTGRGSKMAEWLQEAELGGTVEQTLVETKLGYASRIYRRSEKYKDLWKVLLVLPTPPSQLSMGVISPIEDGKWIVTTGGWFGNFPKPNPVDFENFISELPVPDIYHVIREAEPLSDVFGFRIPGSLQRHYDKFENFPNGLLVVGDALCSLNPLYSQGMTLCAMEASCLNKQIENWISGKIDSKYIQDKLATTVQAAWDMATLEDMRYPETAGTRTLMTQIRHWYTRRLFKLSSENRLALQTQIGVSNFSILPSQLYRPEILLRIMFSVGPRQQRASS